MGRLLLSPVGLPFRQTFERRATSVVCGSPYSRLNLIVDSVDAISKLATHSLTEDQPGQVQKDIEGLARTLAATIVAIKKFLKSYPVHWTDVTFQDSQREGPGEVGNVLTALKGGLEELLRSFGEYFDAMGISAEQAMAWRSLIAEPRSTNHAPEISAVKR